MEQGQQMKEGAEGSRGEQGAGVGCGCGGWMKPLASIPAPALGMQQTDVALT